MEETQNQLLRYLDDLCVRFIINLPQEELESAERICFQIEEAQWFYEDFIRPQNPNLPSMNLRDFCLRIFQHCPLFSQYSPDHYMAAFTEFLAYKTRVPVRGAILLNESMDSVLLVKGWKKNASWSFPRGKINKDERDLDCALREVYEEIGYDIAAAGLVQDESEQKFIEINMREQHIKLYVFRGVPEDTVFQPRTRKEISKIEWYKLSTLPGYRKKKGSNANDNLTSSKLYMVPPFLVPLKKWINEQRRKDQQYLSTAVEDHAPSGYDTAMGYDTATNDYQRYEKHLGLTGSAAQLRTVDDAQQGAFATSGFGGDAPAAPAETMSAELKRMLNLGGQEQAPAQSPAQAYPVQQPASANRLLLLKSGFVASNEPVESGFLPQSQPSSHPSQQNVQSQLAAQAPPQYLQQNQPQHADAAFGFERQPNQAGLQVAGHGFGGSVPTGPASSRPAGLRQQPEGYTQGRPSAIHQPYQPNFGSNILHHQSQIHPHEQARSGWPSHQPGFPNQHQHQPLQGPADQSWTQPSSSQRQAAPAASQLPPPQLSSHHKSLLSAFRSPAATSGQQPQQSRPAAGFPLIPASIPPSRRASGQSKVDGQTVTNVPFASAQANDQPRLSFALGTGPASASATTAPPAPSTNSKTATHQEALLGLFKSKSPVSSTTKARAQTPLAVELPTAVSKTPQQQMASLAPASAPSDPGPAAPMTYAQASKSPSAKPVTVLQRPKAPDSEAPQVAVPPSAPSAPAAAAASKHKHSRNSQSERKSQGTNSPHRRNATPVQVLKRPTNAAGPIPGPGNSSPAKTRPKTPQGRAELSGCMPQTTPKAQFQPQVLQRPKDSPSGAVHELPSLGMASPGATVSSMPEAAAMPTHKQEAASQRDTLLSLFSQPKPASRGQTPQGGSQGSQSSALTSLLNIQPATEQRRPTPEVATSEGPFRTTRQDSTPSVISPSDRGFLMSYLDGVVKGASNLK